MWWWWIINIYFELFDIKINTAFATAHTTSTAHIALGNLTPFDGEMPPHFDLQLTNNFYQYWNSDVILINFSSLSAPEVVKMPNSDETSDGNFDKLTTFLYQWTIWVQCSLTHVSCIQFHCSSFPPHDMIFFSACSFGKCGKHNSVNRKM